MVALIWPEDAYLFWFWKVLGDNFLKHCLFSILSVLRTVNFPIIILRPCNVLVTYFTSANSIHSTMHGYFLLQVIKSILKKFRHTAHICKHFQNNVRYTDVFPFLESFFSSCRARFLSDPISLQPAELLFVFHEVQSAEEKLFQLLSV